jgi:phosphopantothenoylcysteine decarboxylase / phosphopantothenate---cysteine ligase
MTRSMTSSRKKLHILIAAGPTREYLDPVRYLSNDSSGRMGFALARAARKLGATVTLVAGPVSLSTPNGVRRIDVVSAREMHEAMREHAPRADIVIMAAAVADWRPARASAAKMKKGATPPMIRLVKNPDILADLRRKAPPDQVVIGFALETEQLERNAWAKLVQKGCDWIVANRAVSIGAVKSQAILLGARGARFALPFLPKENLARIILSQVLSTMTPKPEGSPRAKHR